MATITVDQFNDDGTTARTVGEVLTVNGARFTQRTDTRWHATAPASMLGTLGGSTVISATLGGEIFLDGTQVREVSYDTGTGTVPAIGTTITQGGVSGYLLAVYADLLSAPVAVGGAVPATGIIKFREVVGGAFAVGALTGIGASATTVGRTSWIEVVADQLANFNVPRLGKFKCRGAWYYLDNTTGSAGQILQVPLNGGGAGTEAPGVFVADATQNVTAVSWAAGVATYTVTGHGYSTGQYVLIESATPAGYNGETQITRIDDNTFTRAVAVNPGVWLSGGTAVFFDFYPAHKATRQFLLVNFSTDERSKFVENMFSGQMRFGSDGTNTLGHVPPAGRRTRVPNIFIRQCLTASRNLNTLPNTTLNTRPDFTTTNAGAIDCEFLYGDWYFQFSQPYSVRLHNCGLLERVDISECATAVDLANGFTGMSSNSDTPSLAITSCFAGGTIHDWGGPRGNAAGTSDHDIVLTLCTGLRFYRCRAGIVAITRSSGHPWSMSQCTDIVLDECRSTNGGVVLATCTKVRILRHDQVDRYKGTTTSSTPYYAVQVTVKCIDIIVSGMTFGLKGLIAGCHPYNGLMSGSASDALVLRDCGTRAAPLQTSASNITAYVFADLGNCDNVRVQRCYLSATRSGIILTTNSTKNFLAESVFGTYAQAITQIALNMTLRGCGGTQGVSGQASVYGVHVTDSFTSDTVGRVVLQACEPTVETAQYVSLTLAGAGGFTSAGGVSLPGVGDELVVTQSYFALGHTGFQNAVATITGTNTGNHTYEYQLDTGAGFGAWQTLNGANLSAETISPSAGFRVKFRVTCTVASTTNLISFVRIDTTTTVAATADNLYPLDLVRLTLTGLRNPSYVELYVAGTLTEIGTQTTVTSGTFEEDVDVSLYPLVDISLLGYTSQNARILGVDLTEGDVTLSTDLALDRQYVNI